MKAVVLAGGFGTRLSEATGTIPKPLIEIGGRPILWHIMKIYAAHGIEDFVVCCGYKGELIKEYFLNYFHRNSDLTVSLRDNTVEVRRSAVEAWRVTLVDTGLDTMTGGRLKRVREQVGDETFCLTYGDGVSDIDLTRLIAFHRQQGTIGTVTAVRQPGRFGSLDLSADLTRVDGLREKSMLDGQIINGGFFVLEAAAFDRIEGDATVWEEDPLQSLVAARQLSVFRHEGFWQNMDTLRDRNILQKMWESGEAPWRVWD